MEQQSLYSKGDDVEDHLGDLPQKIANFGWAVVHVDEPNGDPPYSYSVGLERTYQHPEVIVFGLREETRHRIINTIGEQVRLGVDFNAARLSAAVLSGYNCAFRHVAPGAISHYMGIAVRFYGREVAALHCIWPDQSGRFPWEPGTPSEYRRLQPMLSDGPEPSTSHRP